MSVYQSAPTPESSAIIAKDFDFWYGDFHALTGLDVNIARNKITAFIGPSGCGKSTFLRCLNLMNREIRACDVNGQIIYHGRNVNTREENLFELRRSIGMVFQHSTPVPMSIRDNVLSGPARMGKLGRAQADELVERCLTEAALWDEVKDKLDRSGLSLSGGQQQRLCIARTLAMSPDVVLFDEPCSALDPISTFTVEQTIRSIADSGICVAIVTHNMEQATRVSDNTAFFYMGDMVETGPTRRIFMAPKDQRLSDYLSGRFG